MSSKFAGIGKQSRPTPPVVTPQPIVPAPIKEEQRVQKPLAKSKNPAYTQASAYIPIELYAQTKAVLALQQREFSEYIESLIRADLDLPKKV